MISEEIKNIDDLEDLLKVANSVIDIDVLVSHEGGAAKNNAKIMLKNYMYSLIVEQKEKLYSSKLGEINLKRYISKYHLRRSRLWEIFEKYPCLNRNLGNIPKIFLTKDNNNNKEFASKFFNLFAKYSLILNYDFQHEQNEAYIKINCLVKDFEKELIELTGKDIEVSPAGNGFFGNGYKISVKDGKKEQSFFYKVFYPHDKRARHGADVEVMYAYFATHNGRKKQFVKFYMGRLATPFEKDAFLLTEFIERKYFGTEIKTNKTLSLDYIVSFDKRIDNTINGISVDFGDLKEYTKELNDRKLRQLVRVILQRITARVDMKKVIFEWKMCSCNCNSLKKYIQKYDDELCKSAIKLIENYIDTIPKKFLNDLLNIKNWEENHSISVKKQLQTKDIITSDIRKLIRNIQYLHLNIKSSLEATNDRIGYIILDLLNNRQAVFILDKDNNITRIRLEELENGQFKTILELFGEEIDKYDNPNIVELLCSGKC